MNVSTMKDIEINIETVLISIRFISFAVCFVYQAVVWLYSCVYYRLLSFTNLGASQRETLSIYSIKFVGIEQNSPH